MRKFVVLFVFVAVSTAKPIAAQTREWQSIDSVMTLFIEAKCFNGDMLVTIDRKPFYERAVGFQDDRTKEELRHNSIFNIGSVSKPITSVAILQLQEKKLLNIEDKVSKYIPDFPYDNICIEHLLSHTSGLPTDLDFLEDADLQKHLCSDSVVPMLLKYKVELLFSPGSAWGYSNIGYDVLAVIVERVSKQKFPDYLSAHIFRPAGMTRTFLPADRNVNSWLPKNVLQKDLLTPHMFDNLTSCTVTNADSVTSVPHYDHHMVGSGNVYSCVYDLEKFDFALRSHLLLTEASQKLACTPFMLNDGDTAKDMNAPIPSYYGLGWFISIDTSAGKIIWHKGRSYGSRSVYLRNPSRKQTVTFTDNFDYAACDLKGIACLRIINHQPYRNPVLMSLAQKFGCLIISNGFDFAVTEFERLRTTERKNYYITEDEMIGVGNQLAADNRTDDALKTLSYCKELYPESFAPYLSLGDLYLKINRPGDAVESYKHAVALFSTDSVEQEALLNSIGYYFSLDGRLNDAELVLQLNTQLFPNSGNVYDSYATVLEQNNKLDLAIINEEKAVDIATKNKDVLLPTFAENLERLRSKKKSR
jgi:CubicO group peptidase (beta-lactamase class C family)